MSANDWNGQLSKLTKITNFQWRKSKLIKNITQNYCSKILSKIDQAKFTFKTGCLGTAGAYYAMVPSVRLISVLFSSPCKTETETSDFVRFPPWPYNWHSRCRTGGQSSSSMKFRIGDALLLRSRCQDFSPHGHFAPWTLCPMEGHFAP